jgi:hypothetical protein
MSCCEHGNEHLCSIKLVEFLEHLNDHKGSCSVEFFS